MVYCNFEYIKKLSCVRKDYGHQKYADSFIWMKPATKAFAL